MAFKLGPELQQIVHDLRLLQHIDNDILLRLPEAPVTFE